VVRQLLLVREVWSLNPEPIKSSTRCQRLATAATLMCGPWHKGAELTPLTRDTRKSIKWVYRKFDFFKLSTHVCQRNIHAENDSIIKKFRIVLRRFDILMFCLV